MKEIIVDSVTRDLIGKEITMTGIAVDAKAGACIQLKNGIVYIKKWERWESELLGKQISVTGLLKEEKFIPKTNMDENGAITQGVEGDQLDFVLENIKLKKKENSN